jgi:hypothetical protein
MTENRWDAQSRQEENTRTPKGLRTTCRNPYCEWMSDNVLDRERVLREEIERELPDFVRAVLGEQ